MDQLQRFFAKLLEASGAAVEAIAPEGLEVLAPPPVQQALGVPELARFGFGAELPQGSRRVTLESETVEPAVRELLGERGRRLRQAISLSNPPVANPQRILEQSLDLRNATYRLEGVSPAQTCYEILSFGYTAISDEKRDGILQFGINRANGAALDEMLPELAATAKERGSPWVGGAAVPPLPWTHPQFAAMLGRALPPRLRLRLEPFLRGMLRRQERDLQRLLAYHEDLERESVSRVAALATRGELSERQQAERARELQRLEAIAREYQSKVADVRQRYAMTVEMTWLQSLQLGMPVQRFAIRLKRRRGERLFALDWNPLARKLDQLPCEYSLSPERPREVCDEALHIVSLAANGPCPACGRAFCRACHPEKCPRCGQGTETNPSAALRAGADER
jgi:hypothetical protein